MMRSMTDEQILAKYGYDPEPYLYPDGHRNDVGGAYAGMWPRRVPRSAFIPFRDAWDELPVNPILSAFREDPDIEAWIWSFSSYDAFGGYVIWDQTGSRFHCFATASREQIADARKVIERLAAVAK